MSRAGIRLAFVAALQHLSARSRAVLILRDVLQWSAAEVAELLGTTPTAVHSALRRARADVARSTPAVDDIAEPGEAERRGLVERFAAAIERADASAVAELLRVDAVLEMPPLLTWFTGRDHVARFLGANLLLEPGGLRTVRTRANDQDALGVYSRGPDGVHHAHAVIVLTVSPPASRAWSRSRIPACSRRSDCRPDRTFASRDESADRRGSVCVGRPTDGRPHSRRRTQCASSSPP